MIPYKKIYILCITLTLFVAHAYGQLPNLDCDLTKSYTQQTIGTWGTYISKVSTELDKKYSPELQFKRMTIRHMYIAHLLFNDADSKEIEPQLDGMNKDLNDLEKTQTYAATCIAFRSAYNAYCAVFSPATAVYYLPKSFSYAKDAISKQPNSAYSWAEYGNLQYCYALFLGGNFSDAIKSFSKAVEILEKQQKNLSCNWYYIHTLLFLAKSYEDNKQYAEANKVYDKILKVTPQFTAIHRWKHSL